MPAPVAVSVPHASATFHDGWSIDEMPPYGPNQQDDTIEDAPAPAPVVIVEGFLCASSSAVWGGFADEMQRGSATRRSSSSSSSSSSSTSRPRPPHQVIFAPIGPVSSLHDRACELFYGLLGGRVDYGEKHAKGCGHARYGRRFERGALPQLFARRRGGRKGGGGGAHFIGHSLGGPTIYKLQQLLRQGFFDEALRESDPNFFVDGRTAADLILSITTISSPLRGTPLVHLMGLEPLPYPVVRRWSLGDCIAKAVHVVAFFDRMGDEERKGWLRGKMPDTFADAWHFSPRRRGSAGEGEGDDEAWSWRRAFGVAKLWGQLVKSDWAEGTDCAPWDSTMHERMRVEAEDDHWGITDGSSSEKTWYCCVAAYMTERSATAGSLEHDTPRSSSWLTDLLAASPLGLSARLLGKYPFAAMQPPPKIFVTSAGDDEADDASRSVEHLHVDSGYNSDVDDSGKVRGSSPRRCSLDGQDDGLATALPSLAGMLASPTSQAKMSKPSVMPWLEAWHANDGVVPLASQYHPRDCSQEHCTHHEWPGSEAADRQAGPRASVVERFFGSVVTPWAAWMLRTSGGGGDGRDDGPSKESDKAAPLSTCASVEAKLPPSPSPVPSLPLPQASHYHTHLIPETTHASLAPLWTASQQQVDFWRFIGGWLESVEEAARA